MTTDRRTVSLGAPPGGWASPWPGAFELARVLPTTRWTLIGGAMVQLHALGHDIHVVRPTDDLDLLLHIEVDSDIARDAHRSITAFGYELREPSDFRNKAAPHYRYVRRHAEARRRLTSWSPIMPRREPRNGFKVARCSPLTAELKP